MKEENILGIQTKYSSESIVGEVSYQRHGFVSIKNPCKFVNNNGELMMAPITMGIDVDTHIHIDETNILYNFEIQPTIRRAYCQQFSNIILPIQ